ncbi:MAG: hypothetical protein JXR53_11545 [Bacteroidales bacterium]|nr:hypothetical protein [Bacteroidales bacterium]
MNILVNGIGNIGSTLLQLLVKYKDLLGIDSIFALKNTAVQPWKEEELKTLQNLGIEIFDKDGKNFRPISEVENEIHYVFDCMSNGFGNKNKSWYENLPNLKGASAQGSEKGFGKPFMSEIGNEHIISEKYVQIVSCNTHSLASLLTTFTGSDLSGLIKADFVIVRRSEDLSHHERLVSANVISRHRNPMAGTHHAEDVKDLFLASGLDCNVQSSDITTPSQLMHSVRFNIELKSPLNQSDIENRINKNPLVSKTKTFDSNIIFEFGRRHGFAGRLYSHCIVNYNNLIFENNETNIKGWAFVPQEGNTLISTLHAFLLQTKNENSVQIITEIQKYLIRKKW